MHHRWALARGPADIIRAMVYVRCNLVDKLPYRRQFLSHYVGKPIVPMCFSRSVGRPRNRKEHFDRSPRAALAGVARSCSGDVASSPPTFVRCRPIIVKPCQQSIHVPTKHTRECDLSGQDSRFIVATYDIFQHFSQPTPRQKPTDTTGYIPPLSSSTAGQEEMEMEWSPVYTSTHRRPHGATTPKPGKVSSLYKKKARARPGRGRT